MLNQPIKLQDNLHLYSGDIITINNSKPLLVEITDNKEIRLRKIKDNKYLSQNKGFLGNPLSKSLKFSGDFKDALIFTIISNNGKISLQTGDKYLEPSNKKIYLSSEEKLLTIAKQQNTENIANFEETMEITNLHKDKEKINDKEELIACKSMIIEDMIV
jgi:hypothetical protein